MLRSGEDHVPLLYSCLVNSCDTINHIFSKINFSNSAVIWIHKIYFYIHFLNEPILKFKVEILCSIHLSNYQYYIQDKFSFFLLHSHFFFLNPLIIWNFKFIYSIINIQNVINLSLQHEWRQLWYIWFLRNKWHLFGGVLCNWLPNWE